MPFGWSCSAAQHSPRPRRDCPPTPRGGAAGVARGGYSAAAYTSVTHSPLDKASTAGHGFLAERVNRRADLAPLDGLVEGRQRLKTQERRCEEFARPGPRSPRSPGRGRRWRQRRTSYAFARGSFVEHHFARIATIGLEGFVVVMGCTLERLLRKGGVEMLLDGEYAPSPRKWVRDQVEAYERSEGALANTLLDTGLPVIIVTMRGNKTGSVRKIALMRVAHDGEYALVASMGGAPKHPVWYYNLRANPDEVTIQDGSEPFEAQVREATGDERAIWWERAVAAYPPYAEYQQRTQRQIPVFIASRKG